MGKHVETKPAAKVDGPKNEAPDPGRSWPLWACWLVSAVLLFHITAVVACELAGQVNTSALERDIGRLFWYYVVWIHQEIAHAYFAPNPDPATPIAIARLEFDRGRPDREIRLPDPATRPRIRYLRQLSMAWHLTHEWSDTGGVPRSYWAASYARHLCKVNPGCTRVALFWQEHQMPLPSAVVQEVAQGRRPVLDAADLYSAKQMIGAFSCGEF
jgi:hypothetical protein